MTHNLSSCRGSHYDFTPRIAFVGPVRGLSIQRARKHEGEIPARQRLQPIEPESEVARLQREYIEATKLLMRTASRIETLQMRSGG